MPTQRTQSRSPSHAPKHRVPAYRQRSGYDQAIVTLTDARTRRRRDYWLGEYDSPESRERYHRLIAEWERRGRRLPPPDFDGPPAAHGGEITVVEVISQYWRWAVDYYRPKHTLSLDGALTLLREFYGRSAAADFGPKKLRLLRDHMIRGDGSRRKPWSRKYINSQVQRIRHMFKWAVAQELVPVGVHQALTTLEPLRRGRSAAVEGRKVGPAPQHLIDAVRPLLTTPVRALVDLQLLTGARPGELLGLRPCDIEVDENSGVWTFRPREHKNAYRERERVLYFGPQAQRILTRHMRGRPTSTYLFSPAEAVEELRAKRHADRETPDSCGNRPGTNRRDEACRKPGDRFTTSSYARSIHYACSRAFPPPAHLAKQGDETNDTWCERLEQEDLWNELMEWRRAHRFHPNQRVR
jgi:integrase